MDEKAEAKLRQLCLEITRGNVVGASVLQTVLTSGEQEADHVVDGNGNKWLTWSSDDICGIFGCEPSDVEAALGSITRTKSGRLRPGRCIDVRLTWNEADLNFRVRDRGKQLFADATS